MQQCNTQNRLTIGVLTGDLISPVYRGLVQGVNDAAEKLDVNILYFAGGVINPPDNGIHRNRIYDLINQQLIKGLIVPLSPLSRYCSPLDLEQFLARFGTIPKINVGSQLKFLPSVAPDESGTERLLHHLYFDHGYKRVAMIRGPKNHLASEERFRIYQKFLKNHSIPYDPALIASIDISNDGGEIGVRKLEEQIGLQCDVIAVIGDQMLIRTVKAIKTRGMRIPEDIKIVGLQGVSDGQFFDPPLTVVDDLIFEQGRTALYQLVDMIKGHQIPLFTPQPAELVIRESCGCKKATTGSITTRCTTSIDECINTHRDSIIREMKVAAIENSVDHRCLLDMSQISTILDTILSDLYDTYSTGFCGYIEILLRSVMSQRYKLVPWIGAIMSLYKMASKKLGGKEKERWETLWQPVLLLINEIQITTLRSQEKGYASLTDNYRKLATALLTDYNAATFKEVLADSLGINHCSVVLYDKECKEKYGRLFFAYKNKHPLPYTICEQLFPVSTYLPDNVLPTDERFTFLVEPLYFGENDLGYVSMSMDIPEIAFYASIRMELSGSLNNIFQLQELNNARQRFSDIAYSSSDWLWETDATGHFIYCSKGVQDVVGYTDEEMIGKTLFDLLDESESGYKDHLVNNFIYHKAKFSQIESWNIHKNGSRVGLLISGLPVVNIDGVLTGYRGAFKDITEQKRIEEEIRYLAYYDRLTGLANRALLMDRLQQSIARSKRLGEKFALLFIDLDYFKFINDNLGHDMGDLLLRLAAERMKCEIREIDTVARLGGDEFILLLHNIKIPEEVELMCKRILNKFKPVFDLNGYPLSLTSSIGVSIYPHDGSDSQTLIKNADIAMYKAKQNGRNQYSFVNR